MYTSRILAAAKILLEKKKNGIRVINNLIAVLISEKYRVEEEIKTSVPRRCEKTLLNELKMFFDKKISYVVDIGWQLRNEYFFILCCINECVTPSNSDSNHSEKRPNASTLETYENYKADYLLQNVASLLSFELIFTNDEATAYVKASDARVENVRFLVCTKANNIHVLVSSNSSYDPLLCEFIHCTVDTLGQQHDPLRKADMENSNYEFTFHIDKFQDIVVSVKVYGRHVHDSPRNCSTVDGQKTPLHAEKPDDVTSLHGQCNSPNDNIPNVDPTPTLMEAKLQNAKKDIQRNLAENDPEEEFEPKDNPKFSSRKPATSESEKDKSFWSQSQKLDPINVRRAENSPESLRSVRLQYLLEDIDGLMFRSTTGSSCEMSPVDNQQSGDAIGKKENSILFDSRSVEQRLDLSVRKDLFGKKDNATYESTADEQQIDVNIHKKINFTKGSCQKDDAKNGEEKETSFERSVKNDLESECCSCATPAKEWSVRRGNENTYGELVGRSHIAFSYPIGVASASDDTIIVTDTSNHEVCLLDKNLRLTKRFGSGDAAMKFCRPSAIAVFDDGKFAVKDNHMIQIFSPEGNFLKRFGTALIHPYGLVIDSHQRLLTLDVNSNSKLCAFSKDGEFLNSVVFEPLKIIPPGSLCRFLAFSGGNLVVSDLGLSQMYVTDLQGRELFRFGNYGTKDGKLWEPSGVVADGDGNLLVGDSRNDRIQIFDSKGTFLSVLKLTHPISRPSGMFLTKTGQLFVLNYIHHILFKYKLL